MTSFKGLAWNCGGLRDSTPLSREKAMYFEKDHGIDFDIACFIETHHRGKEEIPPEILRYDNTHHVIHSTVADHDTHAGIIGLVSKQYKIVEIKHLIQGRVLNIKMSHLTTEVDYNISAVYLETNNHLTKAKIEKVVNKLQGENQDHSNNIFLGDFNFIDHEKDKTKGLNTTDKMVCKIWQPFLSKVDMIDPFREQNPKRRVWSFIGTGAAQNSRIDRIYINSINIPNITNLQYIQTPFGGHRLLSFKKKYETEKGKSYYKMNTNVLKDKKYQEIVNETIQEIEKLHIKDDIRKWGTSSNR